MRKEKLAEPIDVPPDVRADDVIVTVWTLKAVSAVGVNVTVLFELDHANVPPRLLVPSFTANADCTDEVFIAEVNVTTIVVVDVVRTWLLVGLMEAMFAFPVPAPTVVPEAAAASASNAAVLLSFDDGWRSNTSQLEDRLRHRIIADIFILFPLPL